jgi:hypothetical protein
MFKEIEALNNFAKQEEATSKFWQEEHIFEKSVTQRPEDNLYVFYDGPPNICFILLIWHPDIVLQAEFFPTLIRTQKLLPMSLSYSVLFLSGGSISQFKNDGSFYLPKKRWVPFLFF